MARRKKHDEPGENGVAVADPPDTSAAPAALPEQAGPEEPKKNRPAASFAAMSDRTTRVEVAVWARPVKVGEAEEYTQYSLTVSRSWRDRDGNWTGNAFHRVHDVPVLLYLVQQAYQWCLAQRTRVRVEADGDVPF